LQECRSPLPEGGEGGDDGMQLVFLAACQSATRSPADAYRGLAPQLLAAGAPAVLAMQDLVPIPTARAFTETFYRQLATHGQVDLAANEARSGLLTAGLPGTAIPVLFMRLPEGRLISDGQVDAGANVAPVTTASPTAIIRLSGPQIGQLQTAMADAFTYQKSRTCFYRLGTAWDRGTDDLKTDSQGDTGGGEG
jgi:hypothetical protein